MKFLTVARAGQIAEILDSEILRAPKWPITKEEHRGVLEVANCWGRLIQYSLEQGEGSLAAIASGSKDEAAQYCNLWGSTREVDAVFGRAVTVLEEWEWEHCAELRAWWTTRQQNRR